MIVRQGQDLAIDIVDTGPRDGQHAIQRLCLKPEIIDATRRSVSIAVELGRCAIRIANRVFRIDLRTEVQSQVVFPLRSAAKSGVADRWVKIRISACRNADVIDARGEFQLDIRVATEVIVVPRNQLARPIWILAIQRHHGIQQTGVRQSLGECLRSDKTEKTRVEIDLESVKIDVYSVRSIQLLTVEDVGIARKNRLWVGGVEVRCVLQRERIERRCKSGHQLSCRQIAG